MADLPESVQKKRDEYLAKAEDADRFGAVARSLDQESWSRIAMAYRDLARQVVEQAIAVATSRSPDSHLYGPRDRHSLDTSKMN